MERQHMNNTNQLKRGLTGRHIRFMALGSAIGYRAFYGSASAIQAAGPAVLLAYMIGGQQFLFFMVCEHWVKWPVHFSVC